MKEDILDWVVEVNTSIIKVIGVGGGGGNAVNYMFKKGVKDVEFVVCNTDSQDLAKSPVANKIQLGVTLTEGRGAGSLPEKGEQAAIENFDQIEEMLDANTKMVFITAGMGGGTGTGAAPLIAKAAKEKGILTVVVVTIPFLFEGSRRLNQAVDGINKLKDNVDSLLIINNEKLSEIYGDMKFTTAFEKADDVLATAVKGVAEIITIPGYVNVDFADVETVMQESGVAVMGAAQAEGKNRATEAIREALTSPLLNNSDIRGARNILLNITSGEDEITMDEVGEITDYVQDTVGAEAQVIWGTGRDEKLGESISVTIVATGFDTSDIPELKNIPQQINLFRAKGNQKSARSTIKGERTEAKAELNKEKIWVRPDMPESLIVELSEEPSYKRNKEEFSTSRYPTGQVHKYTLKL